MNIVLNGTNCFIAYMRYHSIFSYSEVKMTDANFIATIQVVNINDFSNLFSHVEKVKVCKKHVTSKDIYKVYLRRTDLVKEVNIRLRKNGRPDMRYHSNVLAAHQTKINAFFRTTV